MKLSNCLTLSIISIIGVLMACSAYAEGWTVLNARWRPDVNPFTQKQVWEEAIWAEGWKEDEQFYPKHFHPAGSIHIILKNNTGKAGSITLTHIDNQPLREAATTPEKAGRVIWFKVESPIVPLGEIPADNSGLDRQENIPAGEWVECDVRLRDVPKDTVQLRFSAESGQNIDVPISIKPEKARFESISFSPKMDKAYIYIRTLDKSRDVLGSVLLDGKDATASSKWTKGPAGSDITLVETDISPTWDYGTHHLISVKLKTGETLVQPVRAWDNFFSIGLFGTVDANRVKAAKEHGFNTYYAGPSEILDKEGMNYIPSFAIGQGKKRTAEGTGLLFHYNHDEPDAHDWKAGKALPFMDRLGVNAQLQVLPLIRQQRKGDPTVPNLVLVNNTYKPLNWYVYGQIPDILSIDPYAPFNGRQPDYVWKALKSASDASAPRPIVPIIWACQLTGARKLGSNAPTPEEERMMVFYALGCGVKGMGYFVDIKQENKEGKFTGVSDIKPLWEEVGRINKDLAAIAPYASIGCPSGGPQLFGWTWTRSVMCGPNDMLVVAVNTNHLIDFGTKNEVSINIPAKNQLVKAALPPHFTNCKVMEVKGGKLVPFEAEVNNNTVSLSLDEIVSARAFIVSKL